VPEKKKKKTPLAGIGFLFILAALLFWMFQQIWYNERNMKLSTTLLDQLMDYQTGLTRVYEHRTDLLGKQLDQSRAETEKYKKENQQLRQKVVLMDQIDKLQDTIGSLQTENRRIQDEMRALDKKKTMGLPQKIRSLKEGKSLIVRYKRTIHKVKQLIHQFKRDRYRQRLDDQKEVDRIESMLGNAGYLVKDGHLCAKPKAAPKPRIDVDVKFVP